MSRERAVPGDAGSASLLVVSVGSLLSVIALSVGLLATGLAAHRQAVRAADLAALAGAERSLSDIETACRTARAVAQANGADLRSCALQESTLRVEVIVPTVEFLPAITARARAGVRTS